MTVSSATEAFLDEFDRVTKAPSPMLSEVFCSPFLAMDSGSIHALTPDQLAKALPARRAMFDAAGVGELKRTAASETDIDTAHRLVRVEWSAQRADRSPVVVASTFVTRTLAGKTRIAVYINHTDLRALLANG